MTGRIAVGMDVADLPTPVVVIDRSILDRNIAAMAAHARACGVSLRPHWKTTKAVEAARRQLDAGAVGLTTATAAEMLALADGVSPSVFWAYPPVGRERVDAVLSACRSTEVIVGTDSVEAVRELADRAHRAGFRIPVRLDVDTGLHRTGVAPEGAVDAARALAALPGVDVEGVWTHEGHVQGVGADAQRRRLTGLAAGRLLVETAEAIRADGIEVRSVSVGSTPGARSAPTVPGVTEARPGTYVLGDENQVRIGTVDPADVAVSVRSRVLSTQPSEWAIIDAGIKAMSSDGSTHGDGRIGTVVSEGGGVVVTGHEEHGFLRGAANPRVGDVVHIRPNHACGLMNMHAEAAVVADGVVEEVWRIRARH
ncbi:alanine racemase [Microbacterium resistens]|uniref:Alanine racemase n=1 Tax=Microbacterium resistens TaxID=156977 RepID=A0ABY3RN76_9MICO|nr:alanine racemase [Microbacterium resistens]UGS25232.1 alanine racemase [Microbacterium resistens]